MSDEISLSEWDKEFKRIYDKVKPAKKKLTQKEKKNKLRILEYGDLTYQEKKIIWAKYRGVYWSKLKKDPVKYEEFKRKRREYAQKNRERINKHNRERYKNDKEYKKRVLKKNRERYKKRKENTTSKRI
tara:strand:- start:227 stop:613 length:387 start_codon:yes stop_codon:yes gene_type:complete